MKKKTNCWKCKDTIVEMLYKAEIKVNDESQIYQRFNWALLQSYVTFILYAYLTFDVVQIFLLLSGICPPL